LAFFQVIKPQIVSVVHFEKLRQRFGRVVQDVKRRSICVRTPEVARYLNKLINRNIEWAEIKQENNVSVKFESSRLAAVYLSGHF